MIFNVGAGGTTDADKIKYGDSNVGATLDNLNENVDELNNSLKRIDVTNTIVSGNENVVSSFSGYNYLENGVIHVDCRFKIITSRAVNSALFKFEGYPPMKSKQFMISKLNASNFCGVGYVTEGTNVWIYTNSALSEGDYVILGEYITN